MTVREEVIQSAIADVRSGLSCRAAAKKWGVSRSTLGDRLHGAQPQQQSKEAMQRLSPTQESFLADWCLNEEAAGRAPTRKQVMAFGEAILHEGGDTFPLGARWLDRFLRRNPRVMTKNSSLLESARARGSTREAYNDFFDRLEAQIASKNILPANIANMDEHGMQELETISGKVIGSSLTKRAYVISSDATTWVSVIECGTAEGRRLPPCVVFTGASLQGQWFPEGFAFDHEFPGWKYDYSLTGWSNAEIAMRWLKGIYLPETRPENSREWRLLILDEHSSHTPASFMYECFKNKVQLLFLPAHTSHKTQPLDRSVFSPLKNYFRQSTKALASFTSSAPVNKQRFLICYRDSSSLGVCPRNLISGFRNTGIWPTDRSRILDDPEAVVEDEALPATPPPPSPGATSVNSNTGSLLNTPQDASDLRALQRKLQSDLLRLDRSARVLFNKSGKSLDRKNAEIAALRRQIQYLATELEATKPRTKKRVKEGANDQFVCIPDIIAAQEASQQAPKRRKKATAAREVHVVEEAQRMLQNGLECIHVALDN